MFDMKRKTMKKGRYYLGRVIKIGELTQEKLMQALLDPPIIEAGQFDWTITDFIDGRDSKTPYIFGRLSKYAKEGIIKVVDESSRSQVDSRTENLLEASSPFVYLPTYSGIAYLPVWNGIQEQLFRKRFQKIIEEAYDNFFIECKIDSITDYEAFSKRLESIDKFTEISAKVYPPNPLFGRMWEDLHEYVKRRKASSVAVKETSSKANGLSTKIADIVKEIMKNPEREINFKPEITDAAILMAADGYGTGKIVGFEDGEEVIIKTSDSQKSFLFDKNPAVKELVKIAEREFKKIVKERDMKH